LLWFAVATLALPGQAVPTAEFQKLDISALPIVKKIPIGGDPDWLGVGFGSIFVSVPKTNEIVRINPKNNAIQARIPTDQEPCYGIGVSPTHLWVLNCKSKTLTRISPRSNQVDLRVPVSIAPEGEGSIAAVRNSVWFVSNEDGQAHTLTAVDASDGHFLKKLEVGADSAVVNAGFGSIWVTSSGEGKVYRVDPRQYKVIATIPVAAKPRFTVVAKGAVWVLNQSDGTVSRIDPASNRVSATIPANVPGAGGEICAGGGLIWVTMNGTPVTRIDPRSNKVIDQYGNYKGADAIRYGFGSAWVSDHVKGDLWRIDARKMIRGIAKQQM